MPLSSAIGMKEAGETQPRLGVAPARECLDGDGAAVAQVDDRLVGDLDVAASYARRRSDSSRSRS
jgi:hypothetical protein